MGELMSPDLDLELFGESSESYFTDNYDTNGFPNSMAALPEPQEPLSTLFNDASALGQFNESADNDILDGLINGNATICPELLNTLAESSAGAPLDYGFATIDDTQNNLFDWGSFGTTEQYANSQAVDPVTTPASLGQEGFTADVGEEAQSIRESIEVPDPVQSMEQLMAENARLKAMLESHTKTAPKASLPTQASPKTPPKKKCQAKMTSPVTPRNRITKSTPSKAVEMSPTALALSQSKGPIERMWGPGSSPERRDTIHKQQYAPPLLSAPRFHSFDKSTKAKLGPKSSKATKSVKHGSKKAPVGGRGSDVAPVDQPRNVTARSFNKPEELLQSANMAATERVVSSGDQDISLENAMYFQDLVANAPQGAQFMLPQQAQYDEEPEPLTPGARLLQAFPQEMSPQSALSQSNSQFGPQGDFDLGFAFANDNGNDMSALGSSQVTPSHPAANNSQGCYTPQSASSGYTYNGSLYLPAAGSTPDSEFGINNTTPNMSPYKVLTQVQQQSKTPIQTQFSTPATTPASQRKPAKVRASAKKRTPAAAKAPTAAVSAKAPSKVTKTATHKRATSAPSTATLSQQRTVKDLYRQKFSDLSQNEKVRLMLPLLQGLNPETGEQITYAGSLAPEINFDAIGADLFSAQVQNETSAMTMAQMQNSNMGMGMNGYQNGSNVDMAPAMDMVQQAANELVMNANAGAVRQQEALQRAEMLRQAGRRR